MCWHFDAWNEYYLGAAPLGVIIIGTLCVGHPLGGEGEDTSAAGIRPWHCQTGGGSCCSCGCCGCGCRRDCWRLCSDLGVLGEYVASVTGEGVHLDNAIILYLNGVKIIKYFAKPVPSCWAPGWRPRRTSPAAGGSCRCSKLDISIITHIDKYPDWGPAISVINCKEPLKMYFCTH